MNAIIVDDQAEAINILQLKLKTNCPEINIVCTCNTIEDAYKQINELKPELVFLDIDLGEDNSFELLSLFEDVFFKIIFVTGHDEYALKAIQYAALGYIIKPVTSSKLIEAVQNVKKSITSTQNYSILKNSLFTDKKSLDKIVLSFGNTIDIITLSEILYIEASGNYCTVFLANDKKLMVNKTLKNFEDLLDNKIFYRTHKSFIINLNSVVRFVIKKDGGFAYLNKNIEIPVSDTKKHELSSLLENLSN